MAISSTKMRDRVTVKRDTTARADNGDITNTRATIGTFWCNVLDEDSELSQRDYEAPQLSFDLAIRLRRKTAETAAIKKGDIIEVSVEPTLTYQIVSMSKEGLNTTKLLVASSDI